LQALDSGALKEDGGDTKGQFYIRIDDGVWGEQIAEFAIGD